eukprot:308522-Alexandrium_andersonii.AAC.1
MSASLVGSEMCIRDSSSALGWVSRSRQCPRPQLRHWGNGRNCGRGRGAVSYTHLTLPTICSV